MNTTPAKAFLAASTAMATDLMAKGATAEQASATAVDYLLDKTIAERPELALKVYASCYADLLTHPITDPTR